MASLDDFAPQSGATLDDFQIEGPLIKVSNRPSNVNLAAYTAALSENPESVEATYLRTVDELDTESASQISMDIAQRAQQQTRGSERDAIVSILTDPTLSDEQKQAASDVYMDEQSSLYNIRNVLSTEALIADVNDETEESSNARVNVSRVIEDVNTQHREQQARLNAELSKHDPGMMRMGADFVQLLVPYVEQGISAEVLRKARDGDKGAYLEAFTFMGEVKEEFGDIIRRMPVNERGQVIEKIIEAINESPNLTMDGPNEFARMDFLRTALEEGYYGDVDSIIDSAVSLLDLAIPIAGPLVSKVTRLRAAFRARNLRSTRDLGAPVPTREPVFVERPIDDPLRAEEDAAQVAAEARREEFEADPVRRAEDNAERRRTARMAVETDGEDLRRLEDIEEQAATTRRTGGQAARMTDRELRAAEDAAEAKSRLNYVRTQASPLSLADAYRNTNPTKARILNEIAATDNTGQAAEAGYGTTRTEAVAKDGLPEMQQPSGEVRNKVDLPDAQPRPTPANPRVMDFVNSDGAIHLTDADKIRAATRVVNDFNNVAGLVTRTEMTVPTLKGAPEIGGRMNIGVTYGPRDNGWASGQDALDKVKTSLRDYGVVDEDLTLMARAGDEYVPVDKASAPEGGDYLVKVDYPYAFAANEMDELDHLDVMWNWLDRIPHVFGFARQGTISRTLLDPGSMLNTVVTFGASRAVDRSAQLEKTLVKLTEGFSKKYNKLSKVSRSAVEAEIKRANLEGKNKTFTSLRADGWGDEEINALKNWREVWDTFYWLENQDLVKTLRNRNFKVLEDSGNDTRLFVKELPRNQAGAHKRAYDPESGEMVNLDADQLDDLYEKGGSVASMRSPLLIGNDEAAELVISRNQPGGPYSRALRDNDQVLNYREGYYTVSYDAPKFVDKIVRDKKGNVIKRSAVATAPDIATAMRHEKRLNAEAGPGVEYRHRDNKDRMALTSQDNWDITQSAGRTAQRVRGQRLEDATSPITDEAHNHILGPVDSLIRAARNTSSRVGMRDFMEAAKQRAIQQYGHMFPRDKFGRIEFPADSSKIQADRAFSKEAADARTTVEYLNTLENGFINAIDDTLKMGLRAMADAAGEKGFSMTERAANFAAQAGGPTRVGKNTAFTLYLALNPLRQFVVQGHQAVQLIALSPRYAASSLVGDTAALLEQKALGKTVFGQTTSGRSADELKEMFERYEASGLSASIDKSNLVRNSLSEIADATAAGGFRQTKTRRAVGFISQGIAASRKAGFDMGEEINMMTSWLTHYDMAAKQKGSTKFSNSELETIAAKARAYTFWMNRAGEMPYNENFLGMLFQFIQVPHKALLQMTTNRNLTGAQKLRLAAFNGVMYGGAGTGVMSVYLNSWLPQDSEWREAILQGFEGFFFNKLISLLSGQDTNIDFSSLAATDGTGLHEFITSLWTTDVGQMLADSPAGSLVFGSNPRITQFARTVAEYFHFVEDPDLEPPKLSEVATKFLSLSSGFSNAFKARYAMNYEKKYNSSGGQTDPNVNTPEAIAIGLGMTSLAEARRFWLGNELYEASKEHDEDVKETYRLIKQNLAREDILNDDPEFIKRVLNSALELYKDDPKARDIIRQQIRFDVQNGDDQMFRSLFQAFSWLEKSHSQELINAMPVEDEEQRRQAQASLDFLDQYREE